MSEESTLSFRGLCRYIHRLSKASKAGMKAALADCPKRHFPMLEGLLGCIRLHGQDGAVYISDLVQELHQPLPAISRTVRQMEQDGLVVRTVIPDTPPRTEYRLTERGKSLIPLLDQVYDWGWHVMREEGLPIDALGEMWHGYRQKEDDIMYHPFQKK